MYDKLKNLFKNSQVDNKKSQMYKNVFGTVEGEQVLEDLLKFCKVNQPTYVPGDSLTSSYNEGLRRVGLRLLALTQSDNKQYKV